MPPLRSAALGGLLRRVQDRAELPVAWVPSFILTALPPGTYPAAFLHDPEAAGTGRGPLARTAGRGSAARPGRSRGRDRGGKLPLRARGEELCGRAAERAGLVHGPRAGRERRPAGSHRE